MGSKADFRPEALLQMLLSASSAGGLRGSGRAAMILICMAQGIFYETAVSPVRVDAWTIKADSIVLFCAHSRWFLIFR